MKNYGSDCQFKSRIKKFAKKKLKNKDLTPRPVIQLREKFDMKAALKRVSPEDYILSVLTPEERLDAAFKVAREVFKKTPLTVQDINSAVKSIRKKSYGKKK